MPLSNGQKLGPYEVLSPVGAGGMGEVYKARDTRLSRDVAIKVLPSQLSTDEQALARFQKEAQAVAALSHPNVLGIFDFGKEDSIVYAVMELLDGESLREKLKNGPISQRRAIEIAVQLANGLAAAHGKGIIHRDLKPENIFITRDGHTKILDFGLSKRTEILHESLTHAPTEAGHTAPGMILGTVGYMSPEQVRGLPLDFRTDIFSFGAVLYEMLSGTAAFRRETASDTMSAILRDEPPDLSETKKISVALDRIVRHCLEKDPERRFGSAADIAFDLEATSQTSSASSMPKKMETFRKRFRMQSIALIAALLLLPLAFLLGKRMHSNAVSFPSYQRLTFARGTVQGARFAPDGASILYGGAWNGNPYQVYSMRTNTTGSTPLDLSDATVFSVSTTGELLLGIHPKSVGALYSYCTLARVPMTGGTPRELVEDAISADWAPDGNSLAVGRQLAGIVRLEYPLGKVLYEKSGWLSHIRVSPDGNHVAFLEHPFTSDGGSVSVVDRNGNRKELSTGWVSIEGLAWNPTTNEVWFTGTRQGAATKIYSVDLNGGKERLVLPSPTELTLWDISRDGRVLLTQDDWRGEISMRAPGAEKDRDISNMDYSLLRDITPDGGTVAFDDSGEGGGVNGAVFIRRWSDSSPVQLGEGVAGSISPDGKWLSSTDFDGARILLIPLGPGQTQTVLCPDESCSYPKYFPDGKKVVYFSTKPGRASRLMVRSLPDGKPMPISPEGIGLTTVLPVSPNGLYVAALGTDAKPTIFSVDGKTSWAIPNSEAREIPVQWTPDGNSIYLTHPLDRMAQVFRVDIHTGERTLWKQIGAADPAGVLGVTRVFPTPDGNAYAYGYIRILSTLYLVTGLR